MPGNRSGGSISVEQARSAGARPWSSSATEGLARPRAGESNDDVKKLYGSHAALFPSHAQAQPNSPDHGGGRARPGAATRLDSGPEAAHPVGRASARQCAVAAMRTLRLFLVWSGKNDQTGTCFRARCENHFTSSGYAVWLLPLSDPKQKLALAAMEAPHRRLHLRLFSRLATLAVPTE